MKIQIISLFPEMFKPVLETSMLFKAKDKGIVNYSYINLRDFGLGSRKTVDDTPYGGGDGMLLKPEPIVNAIKFAKSKSKKSKVILMTPRGEMFDQSTARKYAKAQNDLIFVCARYEGYDERITKYIDTKLSVGKYILTGGELPAMVVIDAIVRLLPGVLGGDKSSELESFSEHMNFEYPQYTRPENFNGDHVPKVLLSGNHKEIEAWRQNESEKQNG